MDRNQIDARRLASLVPAYISAGKYEDAIVCARGAVALDPGSGEAYNALSAAFSYVPGCEALQLEAAWSAAGLAPDSVECRHNLSLALMRSYEWEESYDQAVQAIELQERAGEVRNPYVILQGASVASLIGHTGTALMLLDQALEQLPAEHPEYKRFRYEIEIQQAIERARLGDFAGMDRHFSGRHAWAPEPNFLTRSERANLLWTQVPDGLPAGARVLAWLEWGLGDQIQFARLVPMMRACSPDLWSHVTVACADPLVGLMKTLPGVDAVVSEEWISEPYDLGSQCKGGLDAIVPVIDLFRYAVSFAESDKRPASPFGEYVGPYLKAPASCALQREPGKIAVGFTWQGDPRQAQDWNRRIPFAEFARWAAAHSDRYTFHAIQNKFAGNCKPWDGWPEDVLLQDCSPLMGSMDDTAGLISECDVFVGQCGGLSHLAGALGVPAVVMLGFAHDWRWDFGPLYGSELVLQQRPGDWASAFAKLDGAIDKVLGVSTFLERNTLLCQ